MGAAINFILALAVATTSLAGGSLIWPRLTTQPRPQLLEEVHNVVLKTQVGQETANVLGVSDERHVTPISPGQVAASALLGIKNAVQRRVTTVIVGNAINQLRSRFDGLPSGQQQEIRQIFCQQPTPSPVSQTSTSSSSATPVH